MNTSYNVSSEFDEIFPEHMLSYVVPMAITALIFHSFGFYMLCKKETRITKIQRILLLNLCASEMSICAFIILDISIHMNFLFPATTISYTLIIFVLTVDRFAQVYLNIRYPLYWSIKRTKYLIGFICLLELMVAAVLVMAKYLREDSFGRFLSPIYRHYWYIIFDISFLAFSASVYVYIGIKLVQNKQSMQRTSKKASSVVVKHILHKPIELIMPLLLILSYAVFHTVPSVMSFLGELDVLNPEIGLRFEILYLVGYICDAIIYMYLSTVTGHQCLQKLMKRDSATCKGRPTFL